MAERPRRREWEAEYVSEYCVFSFLSSTVIYHCRLGTWPTPLTAPDLSQEEQAMLRVRMRWADAVVVQPKVITVVEAKLRASEFLKGVGELQLYTHLVAHTEEFKHLLPRPVAGRLVIPIADPVVGLIARQAKLDVAVYKPSFWTEYSQLLQPRQTRSIRPEEHSLISAKAGGS